MALTCVTGPVTSLAAIDFHIRPLLAVTTRDRRAHLVDPMEDRLIGIWSPFPTRAPESIVVEGLKVRVSLRDGRAVVLTEDDELLHTLGEGVACVHATIVHGAPRVVTGGVDGAIRIWDPASGAPIGGPLRGHVGPVKALCVVDDVLVSSGEDGILQRWRWQLDW